MSDIHAEWRRLQTANAGEIMSFATDIVKTWWRATDSRPTDWTQRLDAYRVICMSGDYENLKNASANFVRLETGIDLSAY